MTTTITDLTGAYGVTRTGGWVGAVIRWTTQLPGLPADQAVNHAFVAVSPTQMVEMNPKGAELVEVGKYAAARWFRPPMTATQEAVVVSTADKLYEHRIGYGFLDILGQFAYRKLHVRPRWLAAWIDNPKRMVCSQSCDWCFRQAGVELFTAALSPGLVAPNDLLELGVRSGWEINPLETSS